MEKPLIPDPRQLLGKLGTDPETVLSAELLSERHGHLIWRLETEQRSYVLKWLPPGDSMDKFPKWAESNRERAIGGDLERDVVEAVTLARTLCEPPV